MKKFLIVVVIFSFFICLAEEKKILLSESGKETGLELTGLRFTFWDKKQSFHGFNLFLGYSFRGYFKPIKLNAWNAYWHAGTVFLLIPYVGAGIHYIWNNGFFLGIETIYIIPQLSLGMYF